MSQEILCTSAPRGLKPGSKGGFCTVAATHGLAGPLAEQLERLSGYRPHFLVGDPELPRNPVSWAHWRVDVAGGQRSVLSRVAFAVDYSQRTSRFAHHLVLEPAEQTPPGPAWVMRQPGVIFVLLRVACMFWSLIGVLAVGVFEVLSSAAAAGRAGLGADDSRGDSRAYLAGRVI